MATTARPTEQEIIDYLLTGADVTRDIGTFSQVRTNEVAEHFHITPEAAFRRMNALAKKGVVTKQRDELRGRSIGSKQLKAIGWQIWEYMWKPEDEAHYEALLAVHAATRRRSGSRRG